MLTLAPDLDSSSVVTPTPVKKRAAAGRPVGARDRKPRARRSATVAPEVAVLVTPRVEIAPEVVDPTSEINPFPERAIVQSESEILCQIRLAIDPRNRLAMTLGAIRGGAVPVGVYYVVHRDLGIEAIMTRGVEMTAWSWVVLGLVLAGLAYSLPTVARWGRHFGDSRIGAVAFAILAEGIMTISRQTWLAASFLGILVAINAIASGVSLVRGRAVGPTPTHTPAPRPTLGY